MPFTLQTVVSDAWIEQIDAAAKERGMVRSEMIRRLLLAGSRDLLSAELSDECVMRTGAPLRGRR